MKKTTREIEYSFDDKSRSFSNPEIFAFPILQRVSHQTLMHMEPQNKTYLVRSRYDSRYISQIMGISTKSIFRIRAFSSWGV